MGQGEGLGVFCIKLPHPPGEPEPQMETEEIDEEVKPIKEDFPSPQGEDQEGGMISHFFSSKKKVFLSAFFG